MDATLRNAVLAAVKNDSTRVSAIAPLRHAPAQGAVSAELVPHAGHVHLDYVAAQDQYVVTHIISREQFSLPGGTAWELHYDEEGFGFLVPLGMDAAEHAPLCLEDKLHYQVYKTESGTHILHAVRGSNLGSAVDLSEFARKHVIVELTITCGASRSIKKLDGAYVKWHRHPGARFLWSLTSVYMALGLSQYSSQPWRWVHAGWPRWRKTLASLGMEEHLVPSVSTQARPCNSHL